MEDAEWKKHIIYKYGQLPGISGPYGDLSEEKCGVGSGWPTSLSLRPLIHCHDRAPHDTANRPGPARWANDSIPAHNKQQRLPLAAVDKAKMLYLQVDVETGRAPKGSPPFKTRRVEQRKQMFGCGLFQEMTMCDRLQPRSRETWGRVEPSYWAHDLYHSGEGFPLRLATSASLLARDHYTETCI